jgi:hypothetical protein
VLLKVLNFSGSSDTNHFSQFIVEYYLLTLDAKVRGTIINAFVFMFDCPLEVKKYQSYYINPVTGHPVFPVRILRMRHKRNKKTVDG